MKAKGQQTGMKKLWVNSMWTLEKAHPNPQVIQQLLQRDKTLNIFNIEHTFLMKESKWLFYPGGSFKFFVLFSLWSCLWSTKLETRVSEELLYVLWSHNQQRNHPHCMGTHRSLNDLVFWPTYTINTNKLS